MWMASAHQYSEKQISSYYQYPLFGWFSSVLSELFIFKKHTHWSEGRRSAAYKYRRLVISIVDAGTDGHLISIALCNCTRGLRRIFPNEGSLTQLRLRMMTFLGHVSFLSQSFIVQSEFPPFYSCCSPIIALRHNSRDKTQIYMKWVSELVVLPACTLVPRCSHLSHPSRHAAWVT